MDAVAELLASIGLNRYAATFAENEIDEALLGDLTDGILKDIGVAAAGHRMKILRAVSARNVTATAAEAVPEYPVLQAAPVANAATKSPAAALAERRNLTVMFCDLVGSTALASRLDPEDMRELVRAYQAACAQAIGKFEGFVAQYLGDGIMAYFGYPQAHEDDAERAVRAGLDLIAAVAKLDTKTKVEVRVGIATGLVVVGDLIGEQGAKERAVTGETPNLAARLQGLAAPGSIVVSAATRRLLGGIVALRDMGPQSVKGLEAPVTAFAVQGLRSFESRFEARAGGLTGFIGREEECSHLAERWKLARQGRGQVVLISGEAGIGKSALTASLADRVAGEPHTRMRYQCTPHHKDSALYPAIVQIERGAGITPNNAPEQKLAKLEEVLALAKIDASEAVPLFAALLAIPCGETYPPLVMSPGQQRQRTMGAMLDQVEGLARQKPVLMIYEDAHWADATSLELLDSLVDRVTRLPVLLIVTGRPEFQPSWAGRHNVTTLSVPKLDRRDARTMAAAAAGGALPAEVLDQIVAKTDGVPLFVEELTKTVLESGALAEDGRSLKATTALPIPATLQDSLMARLDRSNPVKEIAQVGAAIGREFSYKLLLAVAGMDEASVKTALAKLEESELATRRGVPPDATYTFKHALVQDAAYESLLRSRRQTIHRRIAKALRDHFAVVAETEPEIIAHHFVQADRAMSAVEWWTKAGELASRRSANVEAISHFERAINLADALPNYSEQWLVRHRLQVAYGNALIAAQGYTSPQTKAAFDRCIQLGSHIEDVVERFAGFYGVQAASHAGGEALSTLRLVEAYLKDFGLPANGPGAVIGYRLLGSASWFAGHITAAVEALERSIAHYDAERDLPLAFRFGADLGASAMVNSAVALWLSGRIEQAHRRAEQALVHARRAAHANTLTYTHCFIAVLEALSRRPASALRHAQTVVALSRVHLLPFWLASGIGLEGWARWQSGDWETGRGMIEESRRLRHNIGNGHCEALFALHRVEAQVQTDAQVLSGLETLLDYTSRTGERWLDAEVHRRRGETIIRCFPTQLGQAESAFIESLAVARAQGARLFELRASLDLARLYCDTGRQREAIPLLEGALVGFDPTAEVAEALRLLASLDGTGG